MPVSVNSLRTRALCLLTTCLDAVKIPNNATSKDLLVVVETKSGQLLEVSIVLESPAAPMSNKIEVLAGEITSPHRETAAAAFWTVTEAAGYGKPVAVNRPAPSLSDKGKRIYRGDPDLVVWRQKVVRQTPNAPVHVFKEFASVVETCCRFFFNKNRDLCALLGYDIEDLKTYGNMWLNSFWSTGRVVDVQRGDENHRLLYNFLRQRFAEMYRQMKGSRTQNTILDRQSVATALGLEYVKDVDTRATTTQGKEFNTSFAVQVPQHADSVSDLLAQSREKKKRCVLNIKTPASRKSSAAELLAKELGKMPHDVMVQTLTDMHQNSYACPVTRQEAKRQLRLHREACTTCLSAQEGGTVHFIADVPGFKSGNALTVKVETCEQPASLNGLGTLKQTENLAG